MLIQTEIVYGNERRDRETETETERQRETERDRETETERDRDRQTDRQTESNTIFEKYDHVNINGLSKTVEKEERNKQAKEN